MNQYLRKAFFWALVISLFALLSWDMARQWDAVKSYAWRFEPFLFVISIALVVVAYTVSADAWRRVIRAMGPSLSLRQAFRITFLANLGRYAPGRIWQAVGVMTLAEREGVQKQQALSSFVISQVFVMLSSALVVALCFFAGADTLQLSAPEWVFVPLVTFASICALSATLLVVRPNWLFAALNFLLRRWGHSPVTLGFSIEGAFGLTFQYGLFWILHGLAFWFFLLAVAPERAPEWYVAIGAFTLSHQLGYLAILAPGGVGVREFALAGALRPMYAVLASPIAILSRVWVMLAEAIAALIALYIGRSSSR